MSADQIQEMRRKVVFMQAKLSEAQDAILGILSETASNVDVTPHLFKIIEEIGALQAYGDGKLVEFQHVERLFYSNGD